jgi:DNA primase
MDSLQFRDWQEKFRVFIPFYNQGGQLVQYTGRDYLGTSSRKYLNSMATARALYAPHYSLAGGGVRDAGQDVRAAAQGICVLVEGPLDAVAAFQAARDSGAPAQAVALGGCTITDSIRAELVRLVRGRSVLLLLDADEAGERGARQLMEALEPHAENILLAPLNWYGSCKDPGCMGSRELITALERAHRVLSHREDSSE